jgi:hypothetical protein
MTAHIPSATRGECIHHRADISQSLVVVTLLVEPSVPTILPQDVVDVKAIGFGLR